MDAGKGDRVRTSCDRIGEVIEIWGMARTFCRLRLDSGKVLPIMAKDVAEILRSGPAQSGRRGNGEKRKASDTQAEGSNQLCLPIT